MYRPSYLTPPHEDDGYDGGQLSWYEDYRYYDIMLLVQEAKSLIHVLTTNNDAANIKEIARVLDEVQNV